MLIVRFDDVILLRSKLILSRVRPLIYTLFDRK
jgi:hypothetical protein